MSSTDDFPQADFSETPFSPPMTPGFAAPTELGYASPHPLSPSSLTSPPPPTTPKPEFEVTPFLHPKYLFAEFPLPWKKVSVIYNLLDSFIQNMAVVTCVIVM